MPLKPFSAVIDNKFRGKLAFDTNILMYLLDENYPKLNALIIAFANYEEFVDLITNRYTLFELYEKRKEKHFSDFASKDGYDFAGINSDKFFVHDNGNPKFKKLINILSCRKVFGDRVFNYLIKKREQYYPNGLLYGSALFFKYQQEITELVKAELPRLQAEFNIDIRGSLHDQLWALTSDVIFCSRISREDSLVATAFIKPDAITNENNLAILTNDGDFEKFYSEAQSLIDSLFVSNSITSPKIERISKIKLYSGKQESLKNSQTFDANTFALSYIKTLLIENNKAEFLGLTSKIAPKTPDIVSIKVIGEGQYNSSQNLLVVGNNLDFIYLVPYSISTFMDSTSTITLPLTRSHKEVCFKHIPLLPDDPDLLYETQMLAAIKAPGNLVFST